MKKLIITAALTMSFATAAFAHETSYGHFHVSGNIVKVKDYNSSHHQLLDEGPRPSVNMTEDELKDSTKQLNAELHSTNVITYDNDGDGFIDEGVDLETLFATKEMAYEVVREKCLEDTECSAKLGETAGGVQPSKPSKTLACYRANRWNWKCYVDGHHQKICKLKSGSWRCKNTMGYSWSWGWWKEKNFTPASN